MNNEVEIPSARVIIDNISSNICKAVLKRYRKIIAEELNKMDSYHAKIKIPIPDCLINNIDTLIKELDKLGYSSYQERSHCGEELVIMINPILLKDLKELK